MAKVGARDAVGAERAAEDGRNDGPQLRLQHAAAAAAQDRAAAVAREGRERCAPRGIPCLITMHQRVTLQFTHFRLIELLTLHQPHTLKSPLHWP